MIETTKGDVMADSLNLFDTHDAEIRINKALQTLDRLINANGGPAWIEACSLVKNDVSLAISHLKGDCGDNFGVLGVIASEMTDFIKYYVPSSWSGPVHKVHYVSPLDVCDVRDMVLDFDSFIKKSSYSNLPGIVMALKALKNHKLMEDAQNEIGKINATRGKG